MATGIGRGQVCMTPLNLPTSKTPSLVEEFGTYLPHSDTDQDIANLSDKWPNILVTMVTGIDWGKSE